MITAFVGCTKDAAPPVDDVAEGYADLVHGNYAEALAATQTLRSAIDRFVASPSAGRFEFAKRAWLEARAIYGQTEAFRFYGGPIDDETGPEGHINGWPLDEAYIDYVEGQPAAGIVNDAAIEITKAKLAGFNEGAGGDILKSGAAFNGEKAIATGYHAVEFLLWGQDREAFGPGSRPWQDYLVGEGATNGNGARRGQFLAVAAELLTDDLQKLVNAWAPGQDNYRKKFLALDDATVLKNMLTGIGVLTKGELAGERIDVALDTLDQEDEHSCFSDNTHVDILANTQGIRNVYVGRYSVYGGASLSDLVRAKDPELDKTVLALLDQAINSARSIPAPFDEAIKQRDSAGWKAANGLVQTLFALGDKWVTVGEKLGLGHISVSLPN